MKYYTQPKEQCFWGTVEMKTKRRGRAEIKKKIHY